MQWLRRGSQPADGQAARVDLRSLAGMPGRLSFAEGFGGSRMTHVACTVRTVDSTQVVVDLAPAAGNAPPAEAAVILEVANHVALVQCFTSVLAATAAGQVALRTPARPHIMQRRRFPRIDVFLGITLHTPDRPIEAVAAQMINLSIDGAAVVLSEPLEPGTLVRLNLTSLGFHPPEAGARVRRCSPTPSRLWVIGVQFQDLEPSQELYLAKYIADYTEASE
jgi:hypothetical protein